MAKKEELQKTLQASISDFRHGLRVYDQVQMIRVRSRNSSLLIMADYFPTIGQVDGDVELVLDSDTISILGIRGFYMHRKNHFSLLIETQEDGDVE